MPKQQTHHGLKDGLSRRRFLKTSVVGGVTLVAMSNSSGSAQTQTASHLVRFDHVAVPMRNTTEMVAFYRGLGFHVNEGDRICSVHFGDSKINFIVLSYGKVVTSHSAHQRLHRRVAIFVSSGEGASAN